jgi:hypothetical protein
MLEKSRNLVPSMRAILGAKPSAALIAWSGKSPSDSRAEARAKLAVRIALLERAPKATVPADPIPLAPPAPLPEPVAAVAPPDPPVPPPEPAPPARKPPKINIATISLEDAAAVLASVGSKTDAPPARPAPLPADDPPAQSVEPNREPRKKPRQGVNLMGPDGLGDAAVAAFALFDDLGNDEKSATDGKEPG